MKLELNNDEISTLEDALVHRITSIINSKSSSDHPMVRELYNSAMAKCRMLLEKLK